MGRARNGQQALNTAGFRLFGQRRGGAPDEHEAEAAEPTQPPLDPTQELAARVRAFAPQWLAAIEQLPKPYNSWNQNISSDCFSLRGDNDDDIMKLEPAAIQTALVDGYDDGDALVLTLMRKRQAFRVGLPGETVRRFLSDLGRHQEGYDSHRRTQTSDFKLAYKKAGRRSNEPSRAPADRERDQEEILASAGVDGRDGKLYVGWEKAGLPGRRHWRPYMLFRTGDDIKTTAEHKFDMTEHTSQLMNRWLLQHTGVLPPDRP